MYILDIIIIILLASAAIFGAMKGIIRQIFGLLALLIGVYCAFKFSYWAAHYIAQWLHTGEQLTRMLAFSITFIAVMIAVILIGRLIARLASLAALGVIDKILGSVFSVFKVMCILCVLLYIVQHFNAQFHFLPEKITSSFSYAFLNKVLQIAFPYFQQG